MAYPPKVHDQMVSYYAMIGELISTWAELDWTIEYFLHDLNQVQRFKELHSLIGSLLTRDELLKVLPPEPNESRFSHRLKLLRRVCVELQTPSQLMSNLDQILTMIRNLEPLRSKLAHGNTVFVWDENHDLQIWNNHYGSPTADKREPENTELKMADLQPVAQSILEIVNQLRELLAFTASKTRAVT